MFKALADLFPNIGLEKPKFFALCILYPISLFCSFAYLLFIAASYYFRVNRKKFFESYARANNFDPLNPNQWYAQSPEKLLALKVPLSSYLLSPLHLSPFAPFIYYLLIFLIGDIKDNMVSRRQPHKHASRSVSKYWSCEIQNMG